MTDDIFAPPWIAGFWRRIGAFVVDTILLFLFGVVLGLFFKEQFVELGGYGRLVGFSIALIYFGLLNSKLFGGQTLGKKLLDVRVVDASNAPIDVPRSFLRYSVLGVPFFLNNAPIASEALGTVLVYLVPLIVFGGIFSVVYLYIFNRVTRQSLHDLVVGTYVVNAKAEKSTVGPIWRPHFVVVGILVVAAASTPLLVSGLFDEEPFNDLLAAQAVLIEHPSVKYSAVSAGVATQMSTSSGTTTTRYLSAGVQINNPNVSDAELARLLAIRLAESYSTVGELDVVVVVLTYGYDIGIASSWSSHSHSFRPSELVVEI